VAIVNFVASFTDDLAKRDAARAPAFACAQAREFIRE
jgi:hypothetical protein